MMKSRFIMWCWKSHSIPLFYPLLPPPLFSPHFFSSSYSSRLLPNPFSPSLPFLLLPVLFRQSKLWWNFTSSVVSLLHLLHEIQQRENTISYPYLKLWFFFPLSISHWEMLSLFLNMACSESRGGRGVLFVFLFSILGSGGWRDGSGVKEYFQRTWVWVLEPKWRLQTIPWDLIASSGLCRHQAQLWCTDTCAGKRHKIKFLILRSVLEFFFSYP